MAALLVLVLGLVVGSFLGALSWRWPRGKSIAEGRSVCPHCKQVINWYDNIPVMSYLVLAGKCRNCGKKIPRRDFAIELGTGVAFLVVYLLSASITTNIGWLMNFPYLISLIIIFIMLSISIAIFVIDAEHQYIPDTLSFLLLLIFFASFIISDNQTLFAHLAVGLGSALFLLLINLFTFGKGMGLGDVKLAFALGALLGFPIGLVWMFASFILGSIVGIALIALKLAEFKKKIAFGPFLIAGFWVTAIAGSAILSQLFIFL